MAGVRHGGGLVVAGHADLRDDLGAAAVLRQEPARDVQQDP